MTTKDALTPYAGREQAYVKHELLRAYLERFMMILGQYCQEVLYVDCFAGPWESATNDYMDTSFARAVQTIRGCQEKLSADFGRERRFRALFIEENAHAFAKLDAYARQVSTPQLRVEAWNGRFQDLVSDVVEWIGGSYAFVLIDPKGYAGLIEPTVLAPLLRKRNVEALINYMWQFLSLAIGHLDNPAHRKNLQALYGDDILSAPPAGNHNREDWFLRRYRQRLVAASSPDGPLRTRTVSFPVEYPGKDATKYFLIHTTHADLGVIKFAEASQKASAAQNSVRFLVQQQNKEKRTGTVDMFPGVPLNAVAGERTLTQPWLDLLPVAGAELVITEAIVARMIEEHSCFIPELQRGAAALIESGQIQNMDMTRSRPKNVVHFEGRGERLRRLK